MLAGILANKLNLKWKGPVGEEKHADWKGCITQLKSKGKVRTTHQPRNHIPCLTSPLILPPSPPKFGGVGYSNVLPLSPASLSCVSGWDLRSTPPGNALLSHGILDYDLAKRLQGHMNGVKVMPAVFKREFVGEGMWKEANNVIPDSPPRVLLGISELRGGGGRRVRHFIITILARR
jgi:hypothetical protein